MAAVEARNNQPSLLMQERKHFGQCPSKEGAARKLLSLPMGQR
jgi:hypothetical protein